MNIGWYLAMNNDYRLELLFKTPRTFEALGVCLVPKTGLEPARARCPLDPEFGKCGIFGRKLVSANVANSRHTKASGECNIS
jgi:hypothetical protein